ncbi:MAG: TIGR01212 family radical SAM protein [Eubacteriales bacterium]|nr:TIGR01212 family radical SAM protein [Eubacteriales bacterium]
MEYYSLNQYMKDVFGQKVYKIALDAGFTCPNRDGTLGTGGCIFCSGSGSGDFAQHREKSITEQIEQGKERVKNKIHTGKYMAYFQAFTNTYAPVEHLKMIYEEAIRHPDIVGISIATRPDCLSDEVIELLACLNQKKPVWVELGLQTIHEKTASYIRRGYALEVYDDAVYRLKKKELTVITHVILGLPEETKEQMLQTVEYVCDRGIDGIKLQLLHVIRGTDLEKDYLKNKFDVLSMDAYIDIVVACIAKLPSNVVVHRMTGDGNRRTLVAPMWSTNKKKVLNELKKKIEAY